MHPFNAIPIKSWYNDPKDDELLMLIPVLVLLAFAKSIPKVISTIIERIKKQSVNKQKRPLSGINEDSYFVQQYFPTEDASIMKDESKDGRKSKMIGNYETEQDVQSPKVKN